MNSKIDKVIVKCYRKKAEIEEKFARYKTTFDVLIQQIEESEVMLTNNNSNTIVYLVADLRSE